MIDLSGIARHLRLSVDQIRIAADLLEQGYQPAFIQRYRADESGCLPRKTLWTLKLEIDRQIRLQNTRERLAGQLPKGAELDEEAGTFLKRSGTELEVEATLKAFRARRTLQASQERDGQAGQLLEKIIAHTGQPITDIKAWAAEQFSIDGDAAAQLLEQTSRLVGTLIQCDTKLNEKLRRQIQNKAQVRVEACEPPQNEPEREATESEEAATSEPAAIEDTAGVKTNTKSDPSDQQSDGSEKADLPGSALDSSDQSTADGSEAAKPQGVDEADSASGSNLASDASVNDSQTESEAQVSEGAEGDSATNNESAEVPVPVGEEAASEIEGAPAASTAETAESLDKAKSGKGKTQKGTQSKKSGPKSAAKLTPRQRRRRWLMSMLHPMKNLKRSLPKLTAYQQLMLGRGRRSQLVKTHLEYDAKSLVQMARDTFVSKDHPLAAWFETAISDAFEHSLRVKIEADAVSELEELASEKLLVSAADGLRQTLMQRPVRGHRIMVIDTVGPKAASLAIVDHQGGVLATDEIPCSAQPEIVNQNVVRLGELAHKHRVTLVAITNGPARRFLVHSLRELVKQSAESGLRWTMADRGGADAYAAGRTALKELSAHNRRDRAAIWVARSLQNPLNEYLKVGVNRLRLGSYQRELPQEPLKKLVRETISDCVSSQGVDTYRASVPQLSCIAGVDESTAQQIVSVATGGKIDSRQQLLEKIPGWSESETRQAIGLLRIFESTQPLDGTLVHPDDYRLAERLIENTELSGPPAAPEGWSFPEPPSAEPAPQESESETKTDAAAESAPEQEITTESAEPSASEVATGESEAADESESTQENPIAVKADSDASEAAPSESSGGGDESSGGDVATAQKTSDSQDETEKEESAEVDSAAVEPEASDDTAAGESASGESGSDSDAQTAVTSQKPEPESNSVTPEYPEDIVAEQVSKLPIDVEKLARGWQVGREKLRSIANALHTPFDDPRLSLPTVPLLTEMPSLSNLQPGQCVWAVVVGVADFGAFVELAPDCSGLVHISRLSANYVEDPHQVVQVGDLLMTWVVSVDEKKNRVALTALSPDQREAAESESAQRRSEQSDRRGGYKGGSQNRDGAGRGERNDNRGRGQRSGGPNRGRDNRSGGGNRGRGPGGGRGRGSSHPSKPVVIKSKKPKAPISSAMKEGDEPLRSFSDLMQFYEAKRTDVPAPKSQEQGEQEKKVKDDSEAAQVVQSAEASSVKESDASPETVQPAEKSAPAPQTPPAEEA